MTNYHLITKPEWKELNETICGRGGSLSRAHAILHAVKEREGPSHEGYFYVNDDGLWMEGRTTVGKSLYTLPEPT